MSGATQGGLTRFFGERVGGGVSADFGRTRDFGTRCSLLDGRARRHRPRPDVASSSVERGPSGPGRFEEPVVRSSRGWWRLLVPVAAGAAGLLLATSAVTARGTDLRASRTLQVSQLIARQRGPLSALPRQENDLRQRISAATALAGVGDRRVRQLRAAGGHLAPAARLTPVSGPAVTVALDDVPRADQQHDLDAGARPYDLVIHQRGVKGVVNALWSGGAE